MKAARTLLFSVTPLQRIEVALLHRRMLHSKLLPTTPSFYANGRWQEHKEKFAITNPVNDEVRKEKKAK